MMHWRRVLLRSCLAFAAVAIGAAVVQAAPALAANSLYWPNYSDNTIAFANLDNSGGGGQLDTTGATVSGPWGVAIDAATNTLFWGGYGDNTIGFASLDGGGGGALNTSGATVNSPLGVVIDPAANKIYWINYGDDTIAYANLDNTGGGGQLNTTGATLAGPVALAIDPTTNKLYIANDMNNTVSYVNLDGSGGGQLDTSGASLDGPYGVVIDEAANKLYVTNYNSSTISYANADNTGGGGVLNTSGATIEGPIGAAIDPAANKIYVADYGNSTISYANLDGSGGGGQLNTGSATVSDPLELAILKAPSGTAPPTVTRVGSVLSCSQGSWAPDLLGSFLSQSPRTYSYSWTLNGQPIAGASSSSITATSGGQYACQVTASNHAGSTTQASGAPIAITGTASSVGAASAVLNGTVNPDGQNTSYHFEYGTSTGYGSRAPASDAGVGSDTGNHAVAQSISGLSPGRTYHFRVVATNAAGTIYGADQTFKTSAAVLSGLRVSPRKVSVAGRRVNGRCVRPTRKNVGGKPCRRAIKLTIRYTLNAPDTVTLTLTRLAPGRKVKGRCVKPSGANGKAGKCTRRIAVHGKLSRTSTVGTHSFQWNGKIGGRALAAGTYVLAAQPRGGVPKSIKFTIVG